MRVTLCPNCRTIHHAVSPVGLTELPEETIAARLHCKLCGTHSLEFRQSTDAPELEPGEFGYPAVVVAQFNHRFRQWGEAAAGDLVLCARDGLPFGQVVRLARALHLDGVTLGSWISVDAAEILAGPREGRWVDPLQAEVLLFLAHLLGRVEMAVSTAGRPLAGDDAGVWLGSWLQRPNEALGGRLPCDFLVTHSRREVVCDLVSEAATRGYG